MKTITALFLGLATLVLAGLVSGMQSDEVFRDDFELFSFTEVAHGVVELRASDGTVREQRSTDGDGHFDRFPASLVQPGDQIVVFGGFWRAQPFAGEMRLLMRSSDSLQIITPVTTLVARLAESGLVTGTTAAQRIEEAVSLMAALSMVGSDWDQPSPAWARGDLWADIGAIGGLLNWGEQLLLQIAVGKIDERHMQAFPYVNAGIRSLDSGDVVRRWLPGDSGELELAVDLTLESPAGLSYELVDGPSWITVDPDGLLDYAVPTSAESGSGELLIGITNESLGRSRVLSLDYFIVYGTIVAEQSFGPGGGEIWHPNGNVGYRVAEGSASESVTVKLIDYHHEDGEIRTALRTDPPSYAFDPPLALLLGEARTMGLGQRAIDECDLDWANDWEEAACQTARFVIVENPNAYQRYAWNRIPDSAQAPLNTPPGWQIYDFSDDRSAWALGRRCTDCLNRTTPVLFIHGYKQLGQMGGGPGTWGDLPELLHDFGANEFAVYEFRYRSNARFEDLASDLGDAIELIYAETGKPIQIIAHSFGGLVARTYLQGLSDHAVPLSPFTSCAESRHPRVAGLLTLGTPHSGISGSESDMQGLRLPDGRDGLGEGIDACRQLSCWQSGADEQAFFVTALASYFDVDTEPGRLIENLADFQSNPLPVPTKVAIGLRDKDGRYASGDNLISYQGQRFAPALSCDESSCSNQSVPQNHRETVAGVPIGHCVTEVLLGAEENELNPLPGQLLQPPGAYYRNYFHTVPGNPREPKVDRALHMPFLSESGTSFWFSTHDSFNQIFEWLFNANNSLVINIQGQGAVSVLADGELYDCQTSCVLPLTATEAFLTAQPGNGASFEGFSPNCVGGGTTCTVPVGRATTVNAAFSGGDQAVLVVNRTGSGHINVEPGGRVCSLPQCQYLFAPGTDVSLTATASSSSTFSGWSGACDGASSACSVRVSAGLSTIVGAQFSASAPGNSVIFMDDFEDEVIGQIPSQWLNGPWPDAGTNITTDEQSYTGAQSVRVRSFSAGQKGIYAPGTALSDRVRLDARFYLPAGGVNGVLFGGLDYTGVYIGFRYVGGGQAEIRSWSSDGEGQWAGTFATEAWNRIEVDFDPLSGVYEVFVNEQSVGSHSYGANFAPGFGRDLSLRGDNNGGPRTVYFDDIFLFATESNLAEGLVTYHPMEGTPDDAVDGSAGSVFGAINGPSYGKIGTGYQYDGID
ncbi:esterase/lipase family protein [Wenzhouxiangella marina]|uniref:Uncharacterized protein n=1 Tax=Wenzhouxiangella marina TaxID=1579979 RepID=A0A0K0XX74_9GAMM|nr:alpha/beta fold hydrolase [Wenzhouxiangella marina]AKS42211.1 hypothetical protein WM2015_1844 [Wenzhouxiangella marina]MBB6086017.1 hypothetical protein [Wenzhouxiangella marina]